MTRREPTPADAVLVAINIAKVRNEVLIAPPDARRRWLTVLTPALSMTGLLRSFAARLRGIAPLGRII